MNRLPTKQIYLLFIIIVGIIALSVYSTYALFTFENSTSDIVSIHIPNSLTISENIYEYQQITVGPNSVSTTDVDIINSFEYEVCYSVWYKVIGDTETAHNVQIFEKSTNTLTTSGVLAATDNLRVTLVIINDNDSEIKINLGTTGSQKTDGSCSLNISSDKSVISTSYENIDVLTTKLINDTTKTNQEENYLTYKDQTKIMTFKDTDKVYTSNEFTYSNELFTLTTGEYLTIKEIMAKNNLGENDIYICLEKDSCSILYKFKIKDIEVTDESTYQITKYDKLIGYSKGENGIRKINDTDYIYYGDNPNNFIYYNCLNNDDLSTCELWRIVGFFYNSETKEYNTKIVRNDDIGTYQFDYKMIDNENKSSNIWNTSTLYKYLNEEYKLINNYDTYLDEYTYQVERIPDLDTTLNNMKISDETVDSKINILNLSDYLHASTCVKNKISEYTGECLTNNWLNNIEISKEWTLTSKELEEIIEVPVVAEDNDDTENTETDNLDETETEENLTDDSTEDSTDESTEDSIEEIIEENKYVINYVYTIGKNITESDVNDSYSVRPVVYLKSRILLLDGTGSLESPYVVK